MSIKKNRTVGIIIGVVVLVVIAAAILSSSTEKTRVSESKRLSIDRVFDGMSVESSTSIQGRYTGPDDVKLYYLASTDDKHVIGSDAITVEPDDNFTASLLLNTANSKDKSGEIKMYAQNDKGQVTDIVSVKVRLK